MTILSDHNVTEEWIGTENIMNKSLAIMSKICSTYDLCVDSTGPKAITCAKPIEDAYRGLKWRGVKIRIITEITTANLVETKGILEIAEVRHLDDLRGNFVIADSTDYAGSPETQNAILTKLFVSNVKSFVDQQKYFFEMLWNRAVPAEIRLREIEKGVTNFGRTEILYGEKNAVGRGVQFMKNVQTRMDIYFDSRAPSIVIEVDAYRNGYADIRKRGGKIRAFTEITKDNLHYCKELLKIVDELRHLDGIKGGLAVSEAEFMATTVLEETRPLTEVIYSSAMEVVHQAQYIFDTMWNKAISAEERIRAIEEGVELQSVELIRDPRRSIAKSLEILDGTKSELLVLFATPHTFVLAMQFGVASTYRELSERGVKVKILLPRSDDDRVLSEIMKTRDTAPGIALRLSEEGLNTRLSLMVSDKRYVMSWELKDETSEDPYQAAGMATCSNMQSLATSYATIFENLWMTSEISESLRVANLRLVSNDKAMKEFLDIAAHELRTPIQPILGLSGLLRQKTVGDDGQQIDGETRLSLEIIERNAIRLDRLAQDILDVTRIESGQLHLKMENLDLDEFIKNTIQDSSQSLKSGKGYSENSGFNLSYINTIGKVNDEQIVPTVNVDRTRIGQVLSNLVSNAIKFTSAGSVIVTLALSNDPSKQVIISIKDTGSGLDPSILPRLFEKFVSTSEKGTGLGLYICKNIVEAHGGKIWAHNNTDGAGCTFSLTLPMHDHTETLSSSHPAK